MHVHDPNNIKTYNFVRKAQEIIDKTSRKSIKAIAKDLKVSEYIIRRDVNDDIWHKLYVLCRNHFMSDETGENRSIRAKHLMNKIKHHEAAKLCFSLTKNDFSQDEKEHRRNDRWLHRDPNEIPTKFPVTVVILWVVSNVGDNVLPPFFSQGLTVDAIVYT